MAKKSHEIKVGIPGIAQYSWYKEISKKKADINFIKNQIDSFILLIKNKDKIEIGDYHQEFKEFTKLI
ncbi:MAG: hypothetical protein ACTSRI_19400, partial [Promethearchaeota archaeon]